MIEQSAFGETQRAKLVLQKTRPQKSTKFGDSPHFLVVQKMGTVPEFCAFLWPLHLPTRKSTIAAVQHSQIEGTVIDKDRKPVANAQAVLIPNDRRERAAAYKTAVSDQNGRFTMHTIVPGNYKLFAWEDIEPFAYVDPDFVRKYEELSIPVSVSESARLNVETKVIPATQ